MNASPEPPRSLRRYPAFWEKAVPIFLVILGIAVLVLLVIIFAVATGLAGGA